MQTRNVFPVSEVGDLGIWELLNRNSPKINEWIVK